MTTISQVSRRYAEALLETCIAERVDVERIRDELRSFANAVQTEFDLENVLLNPSFGADERRHVLGELATRLGMTAILRGFLDLVSDRKRMGEIPAIAEVFGTLCDEYAGRVRAEVTSASPLSVDALERLARALEQRTGKKVELDVVVDASLIGGFRARVGSIVFDGTLRAELDRLHTTLSASDA